MSWAKHSQAAHSYAPALGVFTFAVLLTGLVALLFGPYAYPPHVAVSKRRPDKGRLMLQAMPSDPIVRGVARP